MLSLIFGQWIFRQKLKCHDMLWVNIDLTAVSGKTSPLRLYLIESSGDDFSRVYFQIGLTFLFLFSHFRLLTFIGTTQAPIEVSELLNVYSNLQKHGKCLLEPWLGLCLPQFQNPEFSLVSEPITLLFIYRTLLKLPISEQFETQILKCIAHLYCNMQERFDFNSGRDRCYKNRF